MRSLFVLLVVLICSTAIAQGEGLRPPCRGAPVPAFPSSVTAPAVQVQAALNWAMPACLGWEGASPSLLVAVVGRLNEQGGVEALLSRFGAISDLAGVRYWSVTDRAWAILITDAYAVTDASGRYRRSDFRPDEMRVGVPLYSSERDSRSTGPVIYRLRVLERSPDRLVVSVVNTTTLRKFLVPLFAPGELQTTYVLERLGQRDWGYYGLSGITTGLLTGGHAASSVNRAVAFYRHFAGIPTDQEPPAAP